MRENRFQKELIEDLKEFFKGGIVLKNDPSYIQGFPDLLFLFEDRWAAFECKRSLNAPRRPNQEYYIDTLDSMSFAKFICPENKEEVLDELQRSFRIGRAARISKR